MRVTALVLCAAVVVAIELSAQSQAPVFRGRDFTISEDGKPQELVAVSEIDLPDEYAETPVWSKAAGVDVASNDVGDKRLFAIEAALGARRTPPRYVRFMVG